jgi:hypothetical protein
MTTLTLAPPKPVTTLQYMPVLTVRTGTLGETLNAFGMDAPNIRIAQEGYADGLIYAVSMKGIGHDGYIVDQATLTFDRIVKAANIPVDTFGGKRSTTEAISRVLAHAIVYSSGLMKRKGLRVWFYYWFTAGTDHAATRARFNIHSGDKHTYAPNMAPRLLFEVTPAADTGTHFAHYQATRTT